MQICVFSAVLKLQIVAMALILFGNIFQAFAADTVNDRAPHKCLGLCYVNCSIDSQCSCLRIDVIVMRVNFLESVISLAEVFCNH